VRGASFREKMLITHRGLSGPAICRFLLLEVEDDAAVMIDLAPGQDGLGATGMALGDAT